MTVGPGVLPGRAGSGRGRLGGGGLAACCGSGHAGPPAAEYGATTAGRGPAGLAPGDSAAL